MTPETIEREALHILCQVVASALHFLPDDPALRWPAEAAREAVRLAARELRDNPRSDAVVIAKNTLANGLAPLAERGFDPWRLYTRATVGKLNCGPLEPTEALVLADLLRFACETAMDGLLLLDGNKRRAQAVIEADAAFHDAEILIAREAIEDWPVLRRRLFSLGVVLAGLAKNNIDLTALGVRRDYATPKQRARAKAAGRAAARKRKTACKRKMRGAT